MSTNNHVPWDSFQKTCPTCQHAVELARDVARYDDSSNISFFGVPVTEQGRRTGPETYVAALDVHCSQCKDTRRILTDEGKRFVRLCEQLGLITGAELERRLKEQQIPSIAEGAG